ncbi:uncharacterized protein BX663DRAFT_500548 [Cokeromyces recurvatus]|uniref:uncharacterized protein n=1 Tax=Cokeromyces recurvatus TaxID=90255 RepID=UPI00221F726B|nr:uncharacterized protein BX663DRAFT_500548 [Cokeromyces recurvatus]KAI7905677.1 hypothetical protein BX663DRAFT_500548 [Cokeromyces recurvatus]
MNKLKKAFSIDRQDQKSSEINKKRFSLFHKKKHTGELPRLSISTPCIEYPPILHSAFELNHSQPFVKYRPRSVQIESNSFHSFNSTSTTTASLNTQENRSLYSVHSDINNNNVSEDQKGMASANNNNDFDENSYFQLGMKYHEKGELEKATYYWRLSAKSRSPVGLFFYGIALRHGWGCKKDPAKGVRYLQSAAEVAVYDLQTGIAQSVSVAKSELVLAIYELGVCFRHGWGVPKNLETATYYFQIASNLGDPDAQNDLGFCYAHGLGVKKDLYFAAKYYRMAEKQGQGIIGNSWIWKEKYDQVEKPGWTGQVKKKK